MKGQELIVEKRIYTQDEDSDSRENDLQGFVYNKFNCGPKSFK